MGPAVTVAVVDPVARKIADWLAVTGGAPAGDLTSRSGDCNPAVAVVLSGCRAQGKLWAAQRTSTSDSATAKAALYCQYRRAQARPALNLRSQLKRNANHTPRCASALPALSGPRLLTRCRRADLTGGTGSLDPAWKNAVFRLNCCARATLAARGGRSSRISPGSTAKAPGITGSIAGPVFGQKPFPAKETGFRFRCPNRPSRPRPDCCR